MLIGPHIHKHRDAIAAGISELVRIRSVQEPPEPGRPFGAGVDRALQHMLALAASLGFEVKHVDGYAGHAEYGTGEELAAVLVHLDTVHEGDGWTYPPFGGLLEDGRIIGRGASDNKGPAVVALYALLTLKELGITGRRRLRLIFGTNEESGMNDLDYYFEREPLPSLAFVPDAGYPIFNVEMGNMNVLLVEERDPADTWSSCGPGRLPVIALQGGNTRTLVPETCTAIVSLEHLDAEQAERLQREVVAHANLGAVSLSGPEGALMLTAGNEPVEGSSTGSRNAVANMVAFLRGLGYATGIDRLLAFLHERLGAETDGATLGIACRDEVSGGLIFFLRTITADGSKRAEALCNVRYPVSHDGDGIFASIGRQAADYGLRAERTQHLLPVHVPEDHPVIARLSRAYEGVTGEPATLLRMGAGTYARKLQGRGVAFGAGLPGGVNTNVHQADEFVRLDDMMRHGEICLQAMYELMKD